MPRGKKSQEPKKKNKKVEEDEENVEDEIIEEEEEETPKKSKKTVSKPGKAKKGKKEESENEDELSDLEVDEEDGNTIESTENDEVITAQRPPIKIIDPKIPIGQLSIQDGLSYYVQVGTDTLNPQLKYGALNLLNQLTGRRRRPPQTFGSKRGGYNPRGGYVQRGGRGGGGGGGRGMMQRNQSRGQPSNNEDLYGEQE
jgi:hypothetical protein